MSYGAWDFLQETLDLGLGDAERESRLRQVRSRSSLARMVDLALARGYARSVGDLLDQTANLRQQKLFNGLLACLQCPSPDFLLPDHEWQDRWRRRIKPSEHPIVLLVPFGPVGFYFDVSQTEETERARQLPARFENPYRMKYVQDAGAALAALTARVLADGVRVSTGPSGNRSAGHIRPANGGMHDVPVRVANTVTVERHHVRFEVRLNRNHSATEQLATLAHEIGHLYCGHVGARKSDWWAERRGLSLEQEEFEAESVARLVFGRIAPGVELPPHLDQYFGPEDPVPDAGWTRVVSAANRVVEHCISGLSDTAASLARASLGQEL